jgi:hypothetical protein
VFGRRDWEGEKEGDRWEGESYIAKLLSLQKEKNRELFLIDRENHDASLRKSLL